MRRRLLLIPFALACATVIVVAQQPATPPPGSDQSAVTFRTETNFVEVHAIVTDEKGAFVSGLSRDDFEVYEDGRLQAPTVFSLVDVPIERPFTPANATAPIESDVRATTRNFDGRVYILLLDDLNTNVTRTNNVRDVAKKFVAEYLGTNDMAAVVFTSGRQESGQELTSSRRLLMAAVDRFQGQKLPSAGAEKLAIHLRQVDNQNALADDPQAIRTSAGLSRHSRFAIRTTSSEP
jgi:VWFA-related protein